MSCSPRARPPPACEWSAPPRRPARRPSASSRTARVVLRQAGAEAGGDRIDEEVRGRAGGGSGACPRAARCTTAQRRHEAHEAERAQQVQHRAADPRSPAMSADVDGERVVLLARTRAAGRRVRASAGLKKSRDQRKPGSRGRAAARPRRAAPEQHRSRDAPPRSDVPVRRAPAGRSPPSSAQRLPITATGVAGAARHADHPARASSSVRYSVAYEQGRAATWPRNPTAVASARRPTPQPGARRDDAGCRADDRSDPGQHDRRRRAGQHQRVVVAQRLVREASRGRSTRRAAARPPEQPAREPTRVQRATQQTRARRRRLSQQQQPVERAAPREDPRPPPVAAGRRQPRRVRVRARHARQRLPEPVRAQRRAGGEHHEPQRRGGGALRERGDACAARAGRAPSRDPAATAPIGCVAAMAPRRTPNAATRVQPSSASRGQRGQQHPAACPAPRAGRRWAASGWPARRGPRSQGGRSARRSRRRTRRRSSRRSATRGAATRRAAPRPPGTPRAAWARA